MPMRTSDLGWGPVPTDALRADARPELGAVFRHHIQSPLEAGSAAGAPAETPAPPGLAATPGPLVRNWRDLLTHPQPPVELLKLAKDSAKRHRHHARSPVPAEISTALYYASIAAALVRRDTRISRLGDEDLAEGFAWVAGQPWVETDIAALCRDGTRWLLMKADLKHD